MNRRWVWQLVQTQSVIEVKGNECGGSRGESTMHINGVELVEGQPELIVEIQRSAVVVVMSRV
jgi:hypothetical protein